MSFFDDCVTEMFSGFDAHASITMDASQIYIVGLAPRVSGEKKERENFVTFGHCNLLTEGFDTEEEASNALCQMIHALADEFKSERTGRKETPAVFWRRNPEIVEREGKQYGRTRFTLGFFLQEQAA
jgi:hypothetical protein